MSWDGADLEALLTLDRIGDSTFRSRHGDANLNGRAYGGQLLGQATMAASLDVDPDRAPTYLQFLFLQGARPDEPITFRVETLQEGRRFTSRHVRGTQGEGPARRAVLDAAMTFARALDSPAHASATNAPADEDPESLPSIATLRPDWGDRLRRLGGYALRSRASIDFRMPELERQLDPDRAGPHVRFWLRAARPVGGTTAMQAAAFAYLSDWWLNFPGLAPHLRELEGERRLYISSLNHAIWFHRRVRPAEWLHVEGEAPASGSGRALSLARVHDREGRLVASLSQECLMAYA